MKKLCILLAIVLLLCLAACGPDPTPPVTEIPRTGANLSSDQIARQVFGPANTLYRYFESYALPKGGDMIQQNGQIYWPVTDESPYQTMDELTSALRGHFSEEIVQELLGRELYISHEGHLYAIHAFKGRGHDPAFQGASFAIESESDDKIVYEVTKKMGYENGVLTDEIVYYTRALQNGRWVFTNFDLLW